MILTLALLLRLLSPANAAIADGDNAALYDTLCGLVNLGRSPPKALNCESNADTEFTGIVDLNISVASEKWRNILRDSNPKSTKAEIAQKAGITEDLVDDTWTANWPLWSASAKKLSDTATTPERIKKLQTSKLQGLAGELARVHTTAAATTVSEIKKQIDALKATLQDKAVSGAAETLRKLVYGDKSTQTTFNPDHVFAGGSSGRAADCIATKANTVAATLVCVCVKDSGGTPAHPCHKSMTHNQNWNKAAALSGSGAWDELIKHCPQPATNELTAARLSQLTTAIRHAIKVDSDHGYLGVIDGSKNCEGTTSNGVCVKYANYIVAGKVATGKIPWLEGLESLATKLETYEEACQQTKMLTHQLKQAVDSAYATIHNLNHADLGIPNKQIKKVVENSAQTADIKKQECEKIEKAELCKEKQPKCKWEGPDEKDGKHCKMNTTAVEQQATQAAATGDATAAATSGVNCSKHTKKEDCEAENKNVKTGEKAKCGWIEEKCKDSSFLLTKKFALSVVSAAFAALLF
uniref:B-VSG n=1 Tax=Trypanosoma brucei brucei (strain 927/4 GUTat10.1) TaxID=185431 RepID=G1CRM2_TRYB2|nr:b-VSG [Trypanosoma brucei brucei TREU927]AEL79559.1 b-VSG [Trypanosoma brucei brucei TREU927]